MFTIFDVLSSVTDDRARRAPAPTARAGRRDRGDAGRHVRRRRSRRARRRGGRAARAGGDPRRQHRRPAFRPQRARLHARAVGGGPPQPHSPCRPRTAAPCLPRSRTSPASSHPTESRSTRSCPAGSRPTASSSSTARGRWRCGWPPTRSHRPAWHRRGDGRRLPLLRARELRHRRGTARRQRADAGHLGERTGSVPVRSDRWGDAARGRVSPRRACPLHGGGGSRRRGARCPRDGRAACRAQPAHRGTRRRQRSRRARRASARSGGTPRRCAT